MLYTIASTASDESALSQAVAVNKALEMQQAKAEAEAEAKVEAKVEAGLEEARALFALRLADLQNHRVSSSCSDCS